MCRLCKRLCVSNTNITVYISDTKPIYASHTKVHASCGPPRVPHRQGALEVRTLPTGVRGYPHDRAGGGAASRDQRRGASFDRAGEKGRQREEDQREEEKAPHFVLYVLCVRVRACA